MFRDVLAVRCMWIGAFLFCSKFLFFSFELCIQSCFGMAEFF